jgi:hypothetical protein
MGGGAMTEKKPFEFPPDWSPEKRADFVKKAGPGFANYARRSVEWNQKVHEHEKWKQAEPEPEADEPAPRQSAVPGLPFEPASFNPDDLTQVPGIVGHQVEWQTASALYPNRPLSLGSALATTSTLIGQRALTPTRAGLHGYFLNVGKTASGKQHPLRCAKMAMDAAGATQSFLGDVKSSVALIEKLKAQSVFCAFIDEYDKILSRILSPRSGGFEGDIVPKLCELWSHELEAYVTPAGAKDPGNIVYAPRVSVLAFTTPANFYKLLGSREITGGFLNRHFHLRGDDDPPLQENRVEVRVPDDLAARLRALRGKVKPTPTLAEIVEMKARDVTPLPQPVEPEFKMAWGRGAKDVWVEMARALKTEPSELKQYIFARVPEMAVRAASGVAFGRGSLVVELPDMLWARALAVSGAETMYRGVLEHLEEPLTHNAMCNEVLGLLRGSEERIEGCRWASMRDIYRLCRKYKAKGGDVDAALKQLYLEERIADRGKTTGGRPSPGCILLEDKAV